MLQARVAGLIVAHSAVTTYHAAGHRGTLTGFFDWDFAGPASAVWDVALADLASFPLVRPSHMFDVASG